MEYERAGDDEDRAESYQDNVLRCGDDIADAECVGSVHSLVIGSTS